MPLTRSRRAPAGILVAALALLLAVGHLVLTPGSAAAATTYTMTASGGGYIAPGGSRTLSLAYAVNGKASSATVYLQYKSGTSWVRQTSVAVTSGKGSITVKPPTTGRQYRFLNTAGVVSNVVTVHVVALTVSGSGVVTTGASRTLSSTYVRNGVSMASGTLALQYKSGTSWVAAGSATVKSGKASITVKPPTSGRIYRFVSPEKVASASLTVRVVPATFTVAGSGAGHGAGMSQYGAYALSKQGKTAEQILETYYKGAALSTASNPSIANPASSLIGVQVYGYPADTGTRTTLTFPSAFSLYNKAGTRLVTYPSAGKVVVGVSGSNVTSTVTLNDGSVVNKVLSAVPFLRFTWDTKATGAASVAGAQGLYKYGDLRVTVLQARPNVVNFVIPNSEYLYGIDEMAASWATAGGTEALKAQVIASRTYAIRKLAADKANTAWPDDVDPACGCNVFDDTRSQNYTGWRKAGGSGNGPWVAAVDATRNDTAKTVQIMRSTTSSTATFAETPFFASTGKGTGWGTANNKDVWGTAQLPYLTSIADTWTFASGAPANPYASWSKSLTQAQVKAIFGLTDVKSVAVSARYAGGPVKTLTATTAAGSTKAITKTSEAWRSALGVQSPWVVSLTGK